MNANDTTFRWWGPSWGAPVNLPDTEIAAPVDTACAFCLDEIGPGQPGVRLPHVGDPGRAWSHYHRDCFLRSVGVDLRDLEDGDA